MHVSCRTATVRWRGGTGVAVGPGCGHAVVVRGSRRQSMDESETDGHAPEEVVPETVAASPAGERGADGPVAPTGAVPLGPVTTDPTGKAGPAAPDPTEPVRVDPTAPFLPSP